MWGALNRQNAMQLTILCWSLFLRCIEVLKSTLPKQVLTRILTVSYNKPLSLLGPAWLNLCQTSKQKVQTKPIYLFLETCNKRTNLQTGTEVHTHVQERTMWDLLHGRGAVKDWKHPRRLQPREIHTFLISADDAGVTLPQEKIPSFHSCFSKQQLRDHILPIFKTWSLQMQDWPTWHTESILLNL